MKKSEMLEIIRVEMKYIPEFIDVKKDKWIWDILRDINERLISLIDKEIYSVELIEILGASIREKLDQIYLSRTPYNAHQEDYSVGIDSVIYIIQTINFMRDLCEDNEFYEACENLQNMDILLFGEEEYEG